jgi:N-sulfoglucosamine sulfohydrolase
MKELLTLEQAGKLNDIQRLWFKKTKAVEELYDTETDPFELQNLAGNSSYSAKLKELREVHEDWERSTQDVGFTPEKEMYLSMWPNGVQPQTKNVSIEIDRKTYRVTLRCDDPGASIVYKTSKSEKGWQLYTGSVLVKEKSELVATAIRYGYKQSGESVLVIP